MKDNKYVKNYGKRAASSRQKNGITIAFVASCTLILVSLGITFFALTSMIGGDKEVAYAADAGALAGAQQISTVTLTTVQVSQLLKANNEFAGLGVDSNGNVCPSGTDANGNPALFNVIAYNNCALYAAEIALKAAAIGTPSAINNANTVIAGANTFAAELTANIKSSPNMANAASQFMSANSINILPDFCRSSANSTTLVPGSLTLAYDTNPSATSGAVFPAAFTSDPTIPTSWINQLLSNIQSVPNGPKCVAAGQVWNFNTITGSTGFTNTLALIPLGPATHLVNPAASYISATAPGQSASGPIIPPNVVILTGQSNAPSNTGTPSNSGIPSNSGPGGNGNGPVSGDSQSNSLNLRVTSAAISGIPGLYTAYIPASPPTTPPTTTTTTQTGGAAYIALINGVAPGQGDFVASMNNAGYTASTLQAQGYANVPLTATTNIAFNDSQTDIFDSLIWNQSEHGWIVVGTDSVTGSYQAAVNGNNAYSASTPPYTYNVGGTATTVTTILATNYNNVVDSPNMASPSIPFMFVPDNSVTPYMMANNSCPQGWSTWMSLDSGSPLSACFNAYGGWIAYNLSAGTARGTDGLKRNPQLDPLGPGGSPALFTNNPNAPVPNSLIHATSGVQQGMTISDALKIVDIYLFATDNGIYFNGQSGWVNNLISIIAKNYQVNYLPTPVGEYRPNGFTGPEYAKAMFTCLHGGLGLANNPPVLPSARAQIFLPPFEECFIYALNATSPGLSFPPTFVSSGMRYFQLFDSSGNFSHYAWPERAGCPQFEMPGTPLQLLQNMNIMNVWDHGGTANGVFNPNDQAYNALLNTLLTEVQQMNANVTLTDLTTVLGGPTADTNQTGLDLGQTFYLMYDPNRPNNDGLVMVSTLPGNQTYQPVDSQVTGAGYGAWFDLIRETEMYANPNQLVGTVATPNNTISYNGQAVCSAPYGDNELPLSYAPYLPVNPELRVTDCAVFLRSSGSKNNHGELHFFEGVGCPTSPGVKVQCGYLY